MALRAWCHHCDNWRLEPAGDVYKPENLNFWECDHTHDCNYELHLVPLYLASSFMKTTYVEEKVIATTKKMQNRTQIHLLSMVWSAKLEKGNGRALCPIQIVRVAKATSGGRWFSFIVWQRSLFEVPRWARRLPNERPLMPRMTEILTSDRAYRVKVWLVCLMDSN